MNLTLDAPPSTTPYPDSPRREMLVHVPATAHTVLDVGCHTGDFGVALKKERGCVVWGLELNPDTAAIAATKLDRVIAQPFEPIAPLPDGHFDAIVFNDVLEHLVDPWAALRLAATKLAPGGCVVASIPNLRNYGNLLHIIRDGDFRYEDTGIRDRTHLRFFTRLSVVRLFETSGFAVQSVVGINEDWWTPSFMRRLTFRIFARQLQETKFQQFAIVAKPAPH